MFSKNTKTDYESFELTSSMKICVLLASALLIVLLCHHLYSFFHLYSPGYLHLLIIAALINLVPITDYFIIKRYSVIERLKKISDRSNFFVLTDIELARICHKNVAERYVTGWRYTTHEARQRVIENYKKEKGDGYELSDDKSLHRHLEKIEQNGGMFYVDKHECVSRVYIGSGYEFTPKHARLLKLVLEKGMIPLKEQGSGCSQMHNLCRKHKDLFIKTSDLTGHTLIFGTTGSGKTGYCKGSL
ncbi:MAG: hypothetical protein ACI4UM_01085 [Succinivibrio sp.]